MKKILSVLLCITLGCIVFGETGDNDTISLQGITLRLEEVTEGDSYLLQPNGFAGRIDARSLLRLSFDTPAIPGELEESPEWKSLLSTLRLLDDAFDEYKRLYDWAKRLKDNKAPRDDDFIAAAAAANKKAIEILQGMLAPIEGIPLITRDELNNLIMVHYRDPYKGLIDYLEMKQDLLYNKVAREGDSKDEYEIVVRAFLIPVSGEKQALHIPGYDNLPQGDFSPANPKGLLLSPQEMKRLSQGIVSAEKGIALVMDMKNKGQELVDSIKKDLSELPEQFREYSVKLETIVTGVTNTVESIRSMKEWKDLLTVPDMNAELAKVIKTFDSITQDSKKITDFVSKFGDIEKSLMTIVTNPFDISGNIEDASGLFATVENDISGIINLLGRWYSDFSTLTGSWKALKLKSFYAEKGLDALDAFIEKMNTVEDTLFELVQGANPIDQFISNMPLNFFLDTFKSSVSFAAMEPDPGYVIPKPVSDLSPALLDLRYTGAAMGDRISITVDIRKTGDDEKLVSRPPGVTYSMEVAQVGWYRKTDSGIIFFTPLQTASMPTFDPNIAVYLEWHYFDRKNPDSFLNVVDPGFGFHAAFLDQNATIDREYGFGVNFSFFGGIARVGMGYNMSITKDNVYWFIGFGLLGILEQLQYSGISKMLM